MVLSRTEINKINESHIRGVDKWNRMHAGLATNLERYDNDIVHIKAENTEKVKLSNFETTEGIVKTWIQFNNELKQAKGWIVYFYKTNASTGFMVNANDLKNKNVIDGVVEQMNAEKELRLVNIFSGVFKQ